MTNDEPTILVADDEPQHLRLLEGGLQPRGFRVLLGKSCGRKFLPPAQVRGFLEGGESDGR